MQKLQITMGLVPPDWRLCLIEKRNAAHERYMDPNLVDTPSYRPYREFWQTLRYIRGDTPPVLDIGCGNAFL